MTSPAPDTWSHLPRQLAEVIGVDGTLALVECFGGLEYYVPRHASETHELARILGQERFARLAGRFGGERIAIPRDPVAGSSKGEIMTLGEQGLGDRAIARQVGVTQRYVRRVLESVPSRPKPVDTRQLHLRFTPDDTE